jgi:hypothetical protein
VTADREAAIRLRWSQGAIRGQDVDWLLEQLVLLRRTELEHFETSRKFTLAQEDARIAEAALAAANDRLGRQEGTIKQLRGERDAALEALRQADAYLADRGTDPLVSIGSARSVIRTALDASEGQTAKCICYPGHHDMPGGREPACPAP